MKKKLLLAVSCVSCPTLFAAVDGENALNDSVKSVTLDEVAVVATRADSRTPIAFTNITAKEISRVNQGVDMPFVLSMSPSLVYTSDAGAGIGYSTLRVRGTDASRINVTTNGIPYNDPESHNVYWVNIPDIASSLKDVQVQRGAGTSTNGAGAFGATINMITDAPSATPFGQFDGTYGMYNTHKETIKVGSGLLGNHWVAEARFSNIGSDGYIDRASTSLYSYFGQIGYFNGPTSLRLLAFGGKEKTYMAWDYASKEQIAEFGRRYNPCGEYTDANGNRAYYKDQYDNYIQHHFQLIGRHQFSQELTLNAALHYTKGDGYYEQYKTRRTLIEYGLQPYTITVTNPDGSFSTQTVKKSDLIRLKKMDNGYGGATASLTYNQGRVSAIFGGAVMGFHGNHFGQIQWVRNYVGPIDPLQEYYRNEARKFDANIYARATVDIYSGLFGFADLQFRRINYFLKGHSDTYDYSTSALEVININRHFNFFNPKIGLTYINAQHTLFGSWSVAHKEPTRDNFIDAPSGRMPVAERLFDYELGYTFTNSMFSAGINLYYMNYKNQLVSTGQISDTGNAVNTNVPKSYRMGIELQGAYRPADFFEWQINATFSRNRINDFVEYVYDDDYANPITFSLGDTPISFSPDIILNNAFNFTYKGFDASLQSHFVSKQYLTNGHNEDLTLDPYFVSNLLLGYSFNVSGLKNLRVGLTINNIFNEKYESNGYAGSGYYLGEDGKPVIYTYSGYAVQAPVNVLASISLRF